MSNRTSKHARRRAALRLTFLALAIGAAASDVGQAQPVATDLYQPVGGVAIDTAGLIENSRPELTGELAETPPQGAGPGARPIERAGQAANDFAAAVARGNR